MKVFCSLVALALVALATAGPVPVPNRMCNTTGSGLSTKYWESVAHAIHSTTLEDLQKFTSRRVGLDNGVPTVALSLTASGERGVLDHAPSVPFTHDFATEEMNLIDRILKQVGRPVGEDGLGPNWSPLERVVHSFHMRDLWAKIRPVYATVRVSPSTCSCLLDTKSNGIYSGVAWVAAHYAHGTPITLLNRPIPVLNDAHTWATWRDRLLHYYSPAAIKDAAIYLRCALE